MNASSRFKILILFFFILNPPCWGEALQTDLPAAIRCELEQVAGLYQASPPQQKNSKSIPRKIVIRNIDTHSPQLVDQTTLQVLPLVRVEHQGEATKELEFMRVDSYLNENFVLERATYKLTYTLIIDLNDDSNVPFTSVGTCTILPAQP